jgi:hypothetical protein
VLPPTAHLHPAALTRAEQWFIAWEGVILLSIVGVAMAK